MRQGQAHDAALKIHKPNWQNIRCLTSNLLALFHSEERCSRERWRSCQGQRTEHPGAWDAPGQDRTGCRWCLHPSLHSSTFAFLQSGFYFHFKVSTLLKNALCSASCLQSWVVFWSLWGLSWSPSARPKRPGWSAPCSTSSSTWRRRRGRRWSCVWSASSGPRPRRGPSYDRPWRWGEPVLSYQRLLHRHSLNIQ